MSHYPYMNAPEVRLLADTPTGEVFLTSQRYSRGPGYTGELLSSRRYSYCADPQDSPRKADPIHQPYLLTSRRYSCRSEDCASPREANAASEPYFLTSQRYDPSEHSSSSTSPSPAPSPTPARSPPREPEPAIPSYEREAYLAQDDSAHKYEDVRDQHVRNYLSHRVRRVRSLSPSPSGGRMMLQPVTETYLFCEMCWREVSSDTRLCGKGHTLKKLTRHVKL